MSFGCVGAAAAELVSYELRRASLEQREYGLLWEKKFVSYLHFIRRQAATFFDQCDFIQNRLRFVRALYDNHIVIIVQHRAATSQQKNKTRNQQHFELYKVWRE